MVQTRTKEKMEILEKEISKLPAIEKTLAELAKNIERQNQVMLRIMESAADDRSTMNEKLTELSMRNFPMKSTDKGEGSSKREEEDKKIKKKTDEESNNDRNKFKKVEMSIFSGGDPYSWLFRAERYFQIHKLTESEKMTVSTISFEGAALNWYHSQEE